MIKRTEYLNKIIHFIDKPLIKALIGVRRSGKTVLLSQIKDELINCGKDNTQIIYMNFESLLNEKYLDSQVLYSYIIEKQKVLNKKIYLLFDEIQNVNSWEKILASFLVDIECDIYITGSNSKLLSSERATHIAGRHVHFNIYPFTFKECKKYMVQKNRIISDEESFYEYLEFGGLPQILSLEDIFNTIVINDIIERNKINDIPLLKKIIVFLLNNIGKVNDYEIDFICYNRNKEKIYIQVIYLLANEETINREFRPYNYINDNYSKYVISADKFDFSRNGIKHYNIIDFLL